MTKAERVKKEEARLLKIYDDIEPKRKATALGLIQRTAHMRITLEDLAADLDEKGYVDWFSQGDQEPYERRRPTADVYNSMNTAYQKAIKQLTDLLPKENAKAKESGDGFDDFINDRLD